MTIHIDKIFEEIKQEREYQKSKGWSTEKDDQWKEADWVQFITHYATRNFNGPYFRKHMLKVATIAVAAVESCDRK